jgi:hypothetical protein
MLRMAEAGELLDLGDCAGDPAAMKTWGRSRTIRAAVLRHLLVGEDRPVHAKGVRLRGVRITGQLDLEAATLSCPLRLADCYLSNPQAIILDYATVSLLALTGCHLAGLEGDSLVVTQRLDLTDSTLTGPLQLLGADITGSLTCSGAQLTVANSDGNALAAARMKVGGDVFLDKEFTAAGAVQLLGVDITGSLTCSGAQLTVANSDGNALAAEQIKVGGHVFLDKFLDRPFSAAGVVTLDGADIAGQLNCGGAQLTATVAGGHARLVATGMKVGGDVFLGGGFTTAAVTLPAAHVGGSFQFSGRLTDPQGFDLTDSRIANALVWAPETQVFGLVSLVDAAVGELYDFWRRRANGYWPSAAEGRLLLNGFTYTRLVGPGDIGADAATVEQRLAWIGSQPVPATLAGRLAWIRDHPKRERKSFATQPYEQLARFYQMAGQDSEGRKVAIARRRDLRRYGNFTWYRRTGNWLLEKTIQYGYQTWRAVAGIAVLYLAVLVIFWYAQHRTGLIVPAQATTGIHPPPSAAQCTSHYPCFYPIGYAIDTVIPLINVHQADYWRPNGSAPFGWFYVFVTWTGIVLGWALATLTVAGYTGLVRNTDAL